MITLYYAKLKTNNPLPYTYLNKKLSTNELLLATKSDTTNYQSLFTMEELESLLGKDITSYDLIAQNDYDEDSYDRVDCNAFWL